MEFHEFKDEMWWCVEALRGDGRDEVEIDNYLTEFFAWGDFANKPAQTAEERGPSPGMLVLFGKLEILEAKAEEAGAIGLVDLIKDIRLCMRWWQDHTRDDVGI